MTEEKGSEYKPLLISGMLAILGTVAGGVIKAYMDNQLALTNFHARLIEHALQSDDLQNRIKSLKFLAKVNLIEDKKMAAALQSAADSPETIPQFSPPNGTVSRIASVREGMLKEHPELAGKTVALVGIWAQSGNVIDAVTPVYAEIDKDFRIGATRYFAQRIGGANGDESALIKSGYITTAIDLYRGMYFGAPVIVHLEVTWSKLTTEGIDYKKQIHSERLGSGKYAEGVSDKPVHFEAPAGQYIYDIKNADNSIHTSGEVYVEDLDVSYRKLNPKA
jgi:hypothetical protein